MKKSWLFLIPLAGIIVLILFSFNDPRMATKARINHLAIYVQDLQKSTSFYKDVIGLDTIPEPFHDGRHTWFSIGDRSQLHIIAGAAASIPHEKNNHICFSVNAIDEFIKSLDQHNLVYENAGGQKKAVTLRVDGVHQIWLQDPDGYWIEINDARD
jgi:lactoylglutathione lyase